MRSGLRLFAAIVAIVVAAACVLASTSEEASETLQVLEALGS